MQAGTPLNAIEFDIDGGHRHKIAWIYDESYALYKVTEVLRLIKKETGVASEEQLQISNTQGAVIDLHRCLRKALEGEAALISTVEQEQLMLQLNVVGKVAGKGRATGAAAGCAGSCSTYTSLPAKQHYSEPPLSLVSLACTMRCRCQQGQEQRQKYRQAGQQHHSSNSSSSSRTTCCW